MSRDAERQQLKSRKRCRVAHKMRNIVAETGVLSALSESKLRFSHQLMVQLYVAQIWDMFGFCNC